jgi:hypothetical protein
VANGKARGDAHAITLGEERLLPFSSDDARRQGLAVLDYTWTFGLGRQGDLVAFATTAFSAAAIAATGAILPPSPCRLASQPGSL